MNGWIRVGTKLETKDFDAQIKYLENKANEMEKVLESDLQIPVEFRMDEESRLKLKSDLQKTKNQIISLQEQANKGINLKPKDTSKNFDSMMKSAKRFALSLISIRGIYTLLSRASQAYMQTDEGTTNQMEANWIGLGAILSPAIELITRLLKKAVTSILHFMSVLTGVNYIEKANTAILKKQTQATNDLAKANEKAIASFDEMNILNDTSSLNISSSGIDTSTLFSLSDISESTRKTIEKIAEALRPVYNILKEIVKFALNNPETILGILGGVGLLSMLAKIIGYAGVGTAVGTGLAGIYALLLAIASIGVITISIKTIIDEYEKLDEDDKGAEKNREGLSQKYSEFSKETIKIGKAAEKSSKQVDNLNKIYSSTIKSSLSDLRDFNKEYEKLKKVPLNLGIAFNTLTGKTYSLQNAQKDNIKVTYEYIAAYYDLYRQKKLDDEQTQDYVNTLEDFIKTVGNSGTSLQELGDKFGLNAEEAEELQGKYKDVTAMLIQVTNNSDNTTNSIFGLNDEMGKIPSMIKTAFVTNANETSKELEETNSLIDKIPSTKNVLINTKVTADVEQAESKIKKLLSPLLSTSSNILNKLGFNIKPPRLAVGGIVNNPGRGVPIGGAITGEVSREGIIPLTDSQAMEELGATIGRHINLNATIPVYVGNRQIAREIKKINADDEFAYNK